jgi:signal transduction histidine kinase/ActR/RegA family two-component response regulator
MKGALMLDFFKRLFDTSDFPARWNCGTWTSGHGWLHIASDLAIWSAYFAIPCILVFFVLRRRDVPFPAIFWLFGAFILACGTTHLMEAIIFWHPVYRLAGLIKLLTAIVSWSTVAALVPTIPKALTMRSSEALEREIAARKQAEHDLQLANAELERRVQERTAQLNESRRREKERADELEAILRATPTPIWIAHDPYCHRISGNPASFKLLGLPEGVNVSATAPAHDPAQRGFREYRGDQPIPPNELPVQKAARGEVVNGAEVKFVFDDGRIRHIYGNAVPLRNADGSTRGSVAAFTDVTPFKEAEEALRQADRRKDEFLATLAHELRNPLAPLRNAVELIRRSNGDGSLVDQALGMMGRQLDQMVRLIDDLLDMSRISRGKVQLRKERIELIPALRSAVESVRPFLEAQSHELTVTVTEQPIYLDADPTRLSQVISNLLHNAAKYTEKGGHIWLTAERLDGQAVVSVRDTGIGIAAEHLPHVFEMFSQVAPALERSQGGLGIGLALVRGLVELHGGTVAARSRGQGQGSEFTVRLPIADGAPVHEAPQLPIDSAQTAHPRRRRILAVDDNRDAADSLTRMLELMGHETRAAYDGLEAVQAAAVFRPEVVLLDIGLPKMNGYEAARQIRREKWGKDVVLIALTGWGQEEDRRRALEAGFDHHLTKPVEGAALERLLALMKPVAN